MPLCSAWREPQKEAIASRIVSYFFRVHSILGRFYQALSIIWVVNQPFHVSCKPYGKESNRNAKILFAPRGQGDLAFIRLGTENKYLAVTAACFHIMKRGALRKT